MPSLTPRLAWLGLAIACALLATTSLVLTNWLDLDPCHLCIFQRLLFMLLACLAALAAVTRGMGQAGRAPLLRGLFGALFCALAMLGTAVATYQSWLQAQPPDAASCLGGEPSLIERLVEWLGQQVPGLFMATGFCEEKALVIFGLSLANWALVAFAVSLAAALWALWRGWRPGL